MDEEWESPHAGTEEDLESQRAGAGELARGQEPSGFSGGGESGIPETGKGQARGQETAEGKEPLLTAPVTIRGWIDAVHPVHYSRWSPDGMCG